MYYYSRMDTGTIWAILIVAIIVLFIYIVAWCRIFKKAGVHPGKLFIPVYGIYLTYAIAEAVPLFWISMGASVLSSFMTSCFASGAGAIETIKTFYIISSVIELIIFIVYSVRLAFAFGKSGWFAVGLIFLNFIFILILAFGDDSYVGSYGGIQNRPEVAFRYAQKHSNDEDERPVNRVAARRLPETGQTRIASVTAAKKSLKEVLEYAAQFQTADGMKNYLKNQRVNLAETDRFVIDDILNDPTSMRSRIGEMLETLNEHPERIQAVYRYAQNHSNDEAERPVNRVAARRLPEKGQIRIASGTAAQKSLKEVLEYAAQFQTADGMKNYLKNQRANFAEADRFVIDDILNDPTSMRSRIGEVLDTINEQIASADDMYVSEEESRAVGNQTGTPDETPGQDPDDAVKYCYNCGSILLPGSIFCCLCGTRINPDYYKDE